MDSMEKGKTALPIKTVVFVFITALILKGFLFDFMIAEGRSMLPAIEPGSIILVNRAAYGLRLPGADGYLIRWRLPNPGDVVVFYTPQGDMAVKRCIRIIPEGWYTSKIERFFAQGDNTLESFDSRSYGPIPVDRILGKVLGIK